MKELSQFILCNGKVPVAPTGGTIDPHDPANWLSYTDACNAAELLNLKVGFVFTSSDPYWFLDIDHCVTAENQWSPLAKSLMSAFSGACVEVSQSGEGLHIFGSGQVPEHSCKNKEYGIEFYHEGRFVLLNSDISNVNTDLRLNFDTQVQWLVDSYFKPIEGQGIEWRNSPVVEWNGPEDDDMLIAKMCKSKSARVIFGG